MVLGWLGLCGLLLLLVALAFAVEAAALAARGLRAAAAFFLGDAALAGLLAEGADVFKTTISMQRLHLRLLLGFLI
jgi:presenilin-like A22 family membrane protease